ncbi:MAG TPA: NUDIX hydrolase [Ktedonobacterales bacterium]
MTSWYSVRRDSVQTHTGEQISYTYVEHPGAVYVVPVTGEGVVLLIRQYRYPVHDWLWEVPSGGIEVGEDGATAAARELAEEVGATSPEIQPVAAFYTSAGISNERSEVYLATQVTLGQSHREATELLRVVPLPLDVALRMAHAGEMTDAQSALALLLCEPYLRAIGSWVDEEQGGKAR